MEYRLSRSSHHRCPDLAIRVTGRHDVQMEFRVHRGTAEDWAVYREIRLRMLTEAPDAYASSFALEARFPEERWRERAANPLHFMAYAPDGRLAGTATGLPAADRTVDVVAMYVDPRYRGHGCAEQLLDAVVAAARDRGVRARPRGPARGSRSRRRGGWPDRDRACRASCVPWR